jgi:tRNA (cytidine/uridine-2'-O-)-methyltransferase
LGRIFAFFGIFWFFINQVLDSFTASLLFGPETRGLPASILSELGNDALYLPMREGSRSLNLSNTVAIVVYEAWRQQDFEGAILVSHAPKM